MTNSRMPTAIKLINAKPRAVDSRACHELKSRPRNKYLLEKRVLGSFCISRPWATMHDFSVRHCASSRPRDTVRREESRSGAPVVGSNLQRIGWIAGALLLGIVVFAIYVQTRGASSPTNRPSSFANLPLPAAEAAAGSDLIAQADAGPVRGRSFRRRQR